MFESLLVFLGDFQSSFFSCLTVCWEVFCLGMEAVQKKEKEKRGSRVRGKSSKQNLNQEDQKEEKKENKGDHHHSTTPPPPTTPPLPRTATPPRQKTQDWDKMVEGMGQRLRKKVRGHYMTHGLFSHFKPFSDCFNALFSSVESEKKKGKRNVFVTKYVHDVVVSLDSFSGFSVSLILF